MKTISCHRKYPITTNLLDIAAAIDKYISTLDPEDVQSHVHAEKIRQFILSLPE